MIARVRSHLDRPGRLSVTDPMWARSWQPPTNPSDLAAVRLAYTAYRCRLADLLDDDRIHAAIDRHVSPPISQVACVCRLHTPCHGDIVVEYLAARYRFGHAMLVTCWACQRQEWIDGTDGEEGFLDDGWSWQDIPPGTVTPWGVHPGGCFTECADCTHRPTAVDHPILEGLAL